MNFKRIFPLFCSFLVFSLFVTAQVSLSGDNLSSVHVDDLSDAQIKGYYQKAMANGLSENSMYVLLSEKGLPSEEINKLKVWRKKAIILIVFSTVASIQYAGDGK